MPWIPIITAHNKILNHLHIMKQHQVLDPHTWRDLFWVSHRSCTSSYECLFNMRSKHMFWAPAPLMFLYIYSWCIPQPFYPPPPPFRTAFIVSVHNVIKLSQTERLCITMLTLWYYSSSYYSPKEIRRLISFMRTYPPPVTPTFGVEVSHTACKDDHRRSPSHSCRLYGVFIF